MFAAWPKMEPSSVCFLLLPRGLQPARRFCPWESPGKSPGAGCHVLLQCIFPMWGSNLCLQRRPKAEYRAHPFFPFPVFLSVHKGSSTTPFCLKVFPLIQPRTDPFTAGNQKCLALVEKEPEDELLCVLASSGPGGAYFPGSRGGRGVPELVWSSRPGISPGRL